MKAATNQRLTPSARPSRPRKWLAVLALFALIAALGWLGYWFWNAPVQPPEIDLSKADPLVAQAIETARNRVLEEPKSAAAWGELAQVFHVHELPAEAITCYVEAERRDPTDPRWPYLLSMCVGRNDQERRLACLRRAVAIGDKEPALRSSLAEALLELERYDELEPLLQEVLKRNANDAFANYASARLAFMRDDYANAKKYLERSLTAQKKVRGSHLLMAQVCQALGDEKRADEERRLAAQISVEHYWNEPFMEKLYQHEVGENAMLRRAQLVGKAGYAAQAERILAAAVRDYPNSANLHSELGKVRVLLEQLPAAEMELREAVRLNPNLVNANFFLGACLRMQKKYAEALEYQRKALNLQPQFSVALYESSLCLEELGDSPGAIQALRDTLRYDPDMAHAHKSLGLHLAKAKKNEEALPHLQRAATLLPEDEEVKKALAQIQPPQKK